MRIYRNKCDSRGNLFWGNHFADLLNFGRSQTPSLVSRPKFSKNYESTTAITSIVIRCTNQSAIFSSLRGQQPEAIQKNNPCDSTKISPASWCKKSDSRLQKCNRRFFTRSGLSEALPLKAKSVSFWRVGGAGRGVQPFCENFKLKANIKIAAYNRNLANLRTNLIADSVRIQTYFKEHLWNLN